MLARFVAASRFELDVLEHTLRVNLRYDVWFGVWMLGGYPFSPAAEMSLDYFRTVVSIYWGEDM